MVLVTHTAVFPAAHSVLYFPLVFLNRVGWSGVDIFFVLSGYLVGGLLMREYQQTGRIRPGRFWTRRAFKVWPTFYAFLLVMFVLDAAFFERRGGIAPFAAAITKFWPNWLHIQNYRDGNLGWLWSLAVEEHFYLLLPWALICVVGVTGDDRLRPKALMVRMTACFLGISLLCLGLRWLAYADARSSGVLSLDRLEWPTHLRIDSLFSGVFLAYLVRFHDDALQRLKPFRFAILLFAMCTWIPFWRGSDPVQLVFYPFGPTLLYVGAGGLVLFTHLASTDASISNRWAVTEGFMRAMAWVGSRSYAIYVWHGFLAKPIAHRICDSLRLTGDHPGLLGWVHDSVYYATYIVLGAVMYEMVELPGLRLRARLFPPAVASGAP